MRDILAEPWAESPGSRIDKYELIEELGRGTFGAVWRAHDTELGRDVALKVVRPGMDTTEFVARFQQEQQILASLRHPNIATLFGGGVTQWGRPYFAMEYVQGAPLTVFCDREKLGLRQRLQVFIEICRAVQYAHTNNIAHRDLKPANVLVEYGRAGGIRPVVIDFGIAKALAPGAAGNAHHSAGMLVVGTPEYMSPEQASPYGAGIDNRTDVYALGVMLYELLAGAKPFDFTELRRSDRWDEIQRILNDVDPPKPSTRLSTIASADAARAEEIARSRRERVQSLAGTLGGELQWIPMMALRKERAERYGTAQELADDIQRYLDGLPIRAAPASPWYRTRKFLRRNRVPVSIAAALFITVSVATVAGMQARIDRALAAAAVDRAEFLKSQRDLLKALAVTDFEYAARSAAGSGRQLEIRAAALRAAELWQRFCERSDPRAEDAEGRADLASDLFMLGRAALQTARVSASNRLNTTGVGDEGGRARWLAVANEALDRMRRVAPESIDARMLAVMCARSRFDEVVSAGDHDVAIEEGERMLRELVQGLPDAPASAMFVEAMRDVGLIRSALADEYQRRATERVRKGGAESEGARSDLARALEIRNAELERRRARVAAASGAELGRERRDLAVLMERVAFCHRDSAFASLRQGALARAADAAAATLVAEYVERFVMPTKSGADAGEMQEYAGGEMRFADFELDAATRAKPDGARATPEAVRFMEVTERAANVYLETLWRDPSNVRSYNELVTLVQRCLTPARQLGMDAQRALLERIMTVAVEPQRGVRAESFSTPEVARAISALRMAVESRRALFARRVDESFARSCAERSLAVASGIVERFSRGGIDAPRPSVALCAEVDMAVAVARGLGVPEAERLFKDVDALRNRGDLARSFSERPAVIYHWFKCDLDACAQAARQSDSSASP